MKCGKQVKFFFNILESLEVEGTFCSRKKTKGDKYLLFILVFKSESDAYIFLTNSGHYLPGREI
jgi:hypothetical protein